MNQEETQLFEIEQDARELLLTQQSFFKDHIMKLKIQFRRRIAWITGSAAMCVVALAAVHCRLLHHFIF